MKAKIKIIRPASTISLIVALISNLVYIPYFMGFNIDFWVFFTIVTIIQWGCLAYGNNESEPSLINAEELRPIYASCKFKHIVNGILHVPLILLLLIPYLVSSPEFWSFIEVDKFIENCFYCKVLCTIEILFAIVFYFTEIDFNKIKKEIELFENENTTTYQNEIIEQDIKKKEQERKSEEYQALQARRKNER